MRNRTLRAHPVLTEHIASNNLSSVCSKVYPPCPWAKRRNSRTRRTRHGSCFGSTKSLSSKNLAYPFSAVCRRSPLTGIAGLPGYAPTPITSDFRCYGSLGAAFRQVLARKCLTRPSIASPGYVRYVQSLRKACRGRSGHSQPDGHQEACARCLRDGTLA